MKYDLQKQEQHAQEQIRRNPPFENAYTVEIERLRAIEKEYLAMKEALQNSKEFVLWLAARRMQP